MVKHSPESDFLVDLFRTLETKGIRYAVLRNAESLPYALNGSDIDILIPQDGLVETEKLIRKCAENAGGSCVGEIRAPGFVELSFLGCANDGWWGCCLDVMAGSSIWLQINEKVLFSRTIDNGFGVRVLEPMAADFLGFTKELLMAGRFSTRYHSGAAESLRNSSTDGLLLQSCVQKFVRRCIANQSLPKMRRFAVLIHMITLSMVRQPVKSAKGLSGFYFSKLNRVLHPCGHLIAVLGTDGSGKSTIINEIIPPLKQATHNSIVIHHLKPDLLPPLGRLRGVKHPAGYVCVDPHGAPPSGMAGSMFRLVYLTLDYCLGYWLRIRFKLARLPVGVWIFDRYAYDLAIDPLRFRVKLPSLIIRMALFFIPKPDVVLCLGGDADKIYERKPEINRSEVARQLMELKTLCGKDKRMHWIDTTKSVEESVNEVLSVLAREMK